MDTIFKRIENLATQIREFDEFITYVKAGRNPQRLELSMRSRLGEEGKHISLIKDSDNDFINEILNVLEKKKQDDLKWLEYAVKEATEKFGRIAKNDEPED